MLLLIKVAQVLRRRCYEAYSPNLVEGAFSEVRFPKQPASNY
jgi:hypothetical protein